MVTRIDGGDKDEENLKRNRGVSVDLANIRTNRSVMEWVFSG